jgi:hypothetical protein
LAGFFFFFLFSTLNLSSHFILAGQEKSADNLMHIFLYVTCCISPAAFKLLSLTFATGLLSVSMKNSLSFPFEDFELHRSDSYISPPRSGRVWVIISLNQLSPPTHIF